jgi:hypothetical protein
MNKDASLDFILSALHFIPVSSKMAMCFKEGREYEAMDAGYDYEKTGFASLEAYLHDTLYSNHSFKSQMILNGARSQLTRLLEAQMQDLRYRLTLLQSNEETLQKEWDALKAKEEVNAQLLDAMHEEIEEAKVRMRGFVKHLEGFIRSEIARLADVMRGRLIDALVYGLEKQKNLLDAKGVQSIVEVALKDGLIDIIRDYRYKFYKHAEELFKEINTRYASYAFSTLDENEHFLEAVQNSFEGRLVFQNSEVLSRGLSKHIEGASLKKISSIEKGMQEQIQKEFSQLESLLLEKVEGLSSGLMALFFDFVHKPLEAFKDSQASQKRLLEEGIKQMQLSEEEKQAQAMEVHEQLKGLEASLKKVRA